MWSRLLLFITLVVTLQLHSSVAQLGNGTFSSEKMLDLYEPRDLNTSRIVGGKLIRISNAPWQIALYEDGYFSCGGSIISKDWVLTAAHCVNGGGNFVVRAGSAYLDNYGQLRSISGVYVNGNYNPNNDNYDIALLKVKNPFKWTTRVRNVYLPKPLRKLPTRLFVSGWGTLREGGSTPNRLRGVTIRKISRSKCQKKYSDDGILISREMICAAAPNKDSCQGDSGGPLVHRRMQFGVVSFGIGCARAAYPGVYTNVRQQYRWINSVIKIRGGEYAKWV